MYASFFKGRLAPLPPPAPRHGTAIEIWIRKTHRVLAMLFTLSVAGNFAAMGFGKPPSWITYAPLLPLFLLMSTGLYLFALPYVGARRRRHKQQR